MTFLCYCYEMITQNPARAEDRPQNCVCNYIDANISISEAEINFDLNAQISR